MKNIKQVTTFFLLATIIIFESSAASFIMLRQDGSLKQKTDNGMEWAISVPFATMLEYTGESVTADYVWKGGSSPNELFHNVVYNGKKYYVRDRECALCDSTKKLNAAVIIRSATIFEKPRVSSFKNDYFEQGTIVVAGIEKKGLANLTSIMYFDDKTLTIKNAWVQTDRLSTNEDDVKAIQLIALASQAKDMDIRVAHMENVDRLAFSDALYGYVRLAEGRLLGIISEETVENLDKLEMRIVKVEGESKVNLRSQPGTAGEILKQLDNDSQVMIEQKTLWTETIDKKTDCWYKVETVDNKEEGWLFGGFLSE